MHSLARQEALLAHAHLLSCCGTFDASPLPSLQPLNLELHLHQRRVLSSEAQSHSTCCCLQLPPRRHAAVPSSAKGCRAGWVAATGELPVLAHPQHTRTSSLLLCVLACKKAKHARQERREDVWQATHIRCPSSACPEKRASWCVLFGR